MCSSDLERGNDTITGVAHAEVAGHILRHDDLQAHIPQETLLNGDPSYRLGAGASSNMAIAGWATG